MSDSLILTQVDGPLATITLNRPDKRNAINGEMLEQMKDAFETLGVDPDVHAIVLQGTGVCFAAGIDLMYLGGLAQRDANQLGLYVRTMARQIQTVMNAVENTEKPVIAKIHGFCGGLALELAMACDFRIGNASSTYGVPEIYFGLVPDCGGTTRLTRTLGVARAKELVMLGEMIDSKKAENYGLVNRIYPDDTFDAQANEFIAKVLDRPSRAMGIAKRLIDMGAGMDRMTFMDLEATMQSILITHESFMETFQSGMMKVNEMKKEASAKLRGE